MLTLSSHCCLCAVASDSSSLPLDSVCTCALTRVWLLDLTSGVIAGGSPASDDDALSASPPASASLVPPAPAPRPVYSFSPGVDLYAAANYLFVFCASGYLILDASRVAFPRDTIQSFRGSNATNAWFFFFASLYVMDCTLYFLVYNKWEREALVDASRKRRRKRQHSRAVSGVPAAEGAAAHAHEEADSDSDFEEEERQYTARQQRAESRAAADEEKQSGAPGGLKHRPGHGSSASLAASSASEPDFASALSKSASRVARKARWCFFSHEGGLINVLEVVAALIFLMDAAMTFFAGIAQVARPMQRHWDSATMTGDAVASAIFLADSIVFYHIYVRTLQKPKEDSSSAGAAAGAGGAVAAIPEEGVIVPVASPAPSPAPARVSGLQPRDPWFWTAVLNVGGSAVYFAAAVWGIVRQNVHANTDLVQPGSYDANMLWLTQKLHAIYLGGDVL